MAIHKGHDMSTTIDHRNSCNWQFIDVELQLFRNDGEQTKPGLFENIKEKAKSGFSATKRNFL